MANYNRFREEEIEIIKSGQFTAKELAEKLKRHRVSITILAARLGVKLKRPVTMTKKIKNHDFFSEWSNDMAYLVGFIAADGCLVNGPRRGKLININLSSKDENHLHKINDILKTDYDIKTKKTKQGYGCSVFNMSSPKMFSDLESIGLHPKKSLTLKWINSCPDEHIPHLVRGYFDGDGCVRITKQNTMYMSILGTEDFLNGIKSSFELQTKMSFGSIAKLNNYYVYSFGGKFGPLQFCKWMYENSSEHNRMDRKYDIYQKSLLMFPDTKIRYKKNLLEV